MSVFTIGLTGGIASGKTTVALHRIAYLAFDDASVDSDSTLFAVFSPALRNYVSHVLPSLGVENVRILTWRNRVNGDDAARWNAAVARIFTAMGR